MNSLISNCKAQFITLDGIDGAGKSTNLEFIKKWFSEKDLNVVFTREPGGTKLGEQLRNILLNPDSKISSKTETLLMFAARQQHIEEVIKPNLDKGIHVVSDRFTDATFAYQGGGKGLRYKEINVLEKFVQEDLQPNLTLIFDVPLEISFSRVNLSQNKDRFELEKREFFSRVKQTYLERAKQNIDRYRVIDSNRCLLDVEYDVIKILDNHFSNLIST